MLATPTTVEENNKVILVGICHSERDRQNTINSLNELKRLADTAGYETIDIVFQNKNKIDNAYFLGKGFIESLKERFINEEIGLLIFDDELTPAQNSHLDKDFDLTVIDRTELILKIFYMHAKSMESRLQIRLAELIYQLPRLKQLFSGYDRITGSSHSAGSGASRGVGEKQIDLDRFKIRQEMASIRRKLHRIMQQKNTQAKSREESRKICLVGYTNAGKSTIFNKLTGSDVLVEDKLFATLDSTCRPIEDLKELDYVLTDTVGFIAKLPHDLVASFRATLKEAKEAKLLLHLVDVSDINYRNHIIEVNKVLKEIEADDIPILLVCNKIDQLEKETLFLLQQENKEAVFISAKTGLNTDTLIKEIEKQFVLKVDYHLTLPYSEQKLLAKLYTLGNVKTVEHLDNGMHVLVTLESNYESLIKDFI